MSWEGAVDVDVAAGDARTRSLLDVAGVHPAAVVGVLGAGEAIDSRGFFGAGVVGAAGTARLAPITVKDRHTQPRLTTVSAEPGGTLSMLTVSLAEARIEWLMTSRQCT